MSRYKVRLQKRGKIYYLRYTYQAKEVKESTKTDVYEKACRIRDVFEAQLNNEEIDLYNKDMFFRDLANEYIDNYAKVYLEKRTWKGYISQLKTIMCYFGSKPIKVLDEFAIEQLIRDLQSQRGFMKATINRYLALLSGIFKYAVKRKYIRRNPVKDVPRFKESDTSKDFKYFLDDEVKRILDACSPAFKPFVMTAVYAGLRRGELIGLQWNDINFENNSITVARSYDKVPKSKKVRVVGLHSDLKEQLLQHKALSNGSIYVFPGKSGRMMNDFRHQWKMTLERAGVRYLIFHDLRHTFATKFLKSGNSEAELRELLGHSSFQTTRRYTHLANEHKHLNNAINRINF